MFNLISSLLRYSPFRDTKLASYLSPIHEREITTEPLDTVIIPAPCSKVDKSKFVTQIYVDLDNVLGQLCPEVQEATLIKLHDVIQAMINKFPPPVKMMIYGNLSYWDLKEQCWEWHDNKVNFIDTPVQNNRYGKTITDEIMITHIARQASATSTTVLVSCDVGFSPILQDIAEHDGVRTELILFGHAHYQLKQAAFVRHSGAEILSRASVLTNKMAKTTLESHLQAQLEDSVTLSKVKLWLADFKSEWRYKGFKSYLSNFVPDNWVIDSVNNQLKRLTSSETKSTISANELEALYQNLALPNNSKDHFKIIFEVAAKLKTRNIDLIKDAVVDEFFEQDLPIVPEKDILIVLQKILPQLVSKKRPRQLAKAYLRYVLQKARLMSLNLKPKERLYLARLLWS